MDLRAEVGSTLSSAGSLRNDRANKRPRRIMINFETTQVKDEFERIQKLGAEVIREPYEMGGGWIATLADPGWELLSTGNPNE